MADPQIIQQTQTSIPEYARPYVENLLGTAAGTIYDYQRDANGNVVLDASGMPIISGFKQPVPYDGERVAQFSPLQQQSYAAASGMQPSDYLADAAGIAGLVADKASGMDYANRTYDNFYTAPDAYQGFDFQRQDVEGQTVTAPTMQGAQTSYRPDLQTFQQGPATQVSSTAVTAPTATAAQTGYQPNLQTFQQANVGNVSSQAVSAPTMQAARGSYDANLQNFQQGDAERVATQSILAPGTTEAYMSPYMQNVVEIQKREAQRQADIARQGRYGEAVRAGAYGGSRQAILDAEAQRNLEMLKDDIQAKGLQSAYEQAQRQFNTEQQQGLAAQQSNQQAGLTVGQNNLNALLSTQQLGTQTGLQAMLANLSNEQQAAVNNQAIQFQAAGMSAQQALQAALANQQTQYNVGQNNLNAQLSTQQLGAQQSLQAALANLSNEQQTAIANQAAQLQASGMTAQQALQAALANQQAELTVDQNNLNAQLSTQQLGAQQNLQTALANLTNEQQAAVNNQALQFQAAGMTAQQAMQAALANQQNLLATQQAQAQDTQYGYGQQMTAAGQEAQFDQTSSQLGQQDAQFGANLGLQALQVGNQAANTLGSLGAQDYTQDLGIANLQNTLGTQQQQQMQNVINADYNDYLNDQNLPYQQMGFMSDMLRGSSNLTQATNTMFQAPPTITSQLIGAGTALAGTNRLFAKGGRVGEKRQRRSSGLADLLIAQIN